MPALPVRIRLCGHLVVERDGHALTDRALGSRKGRLLLQLLAAHRGRLVATERIADVLWHDEQPRDAAANVATLVSRLRSVLGDDVIAGSRAAYGLLPGGAWVTDVDAARELVVEATDRHRAGEAGIACVAATRARGLLGEPFASDNLEENFNPVGRIYYNFSNFLCVPNAMSQTGGYALGAQAGEAAIGEVVTDAGFTQFRRVAETPFNLVFEARP